MRREEQWENKSIYVFYLELVTGKYLCFIVFINLKAYIYIYFVCLIFLLQILLN